MTKTTAEIIQELRLIPDAPIAGLAFIQEVGDISETQYNAMIERHRKRINVEVKK